ncbi:MAG: CoA transferase [Dehalococcoidia bacterium]|nr:CoA transferase [Dehalococcoidia bacterium]
MGKLPMEGIRIADFTWWLAGTNATRILANYGAEVIKIESSAHMDTARNVNPALPAKPGTGVSSGYNVLNPSKLAINLNLKHPKGIELVKRLIAVSDIVSDNMSGGATERLGLGYDELVKIKPDIIVINMPVMGPGGPHSHWTGQGDQITAAAGLWHMTGYPDKLGVGPGSVLTDWSGVPYHATTAMLAALHYRNRTGKGQHIVLSQYEAAIDSLGTAILDYTVNGRVQSRTGNRSPYGAPHGVYQCQGEDRWCAIDVSSDEQWQGLCRAMGDPEWSRTGVFTTVLGRMENVDELDSLIEEWTSDRTAEDVTKRLQGHGVPAGTVQNGRDLLENDPQLKARDYFVSLRYPEGGEMYVGADSFTLSETPGRPRMHAPLWGEHNEHVFREILKLSADEYAEYELDGVFQ